MKVRVAVGNVKKYIDFDGNDVETFITCVAQAFGIRSDDKYSVRIYDNCGFELVNKNIFHHAISKYCDDASFFLTVEFVTIGVQPLEKITKETLRSYLIENDGARIVNEFALSQKLTDSSRHKLADVLADFVLAKFGPYPTREEKTLTSKLAIELFPSLGVSNSKIDGIDLLFNSTAGTGILIAKLKKKRQKIKQQRIREKCNENSDADDSNDTYLEENAKNDIEFMRTTVVTEENILVFKEKAVLTHKYRTQLLLDKTVDLQETFPYFFVRSDLILHVFDQCVPCRKQNGLADVWSVLLPKLLLKQGSDKPDFATIWNSDIENALLLILFLPCHSPKTAFGCAVQKIIVFHRLNTPPMSSMVRHNKSPYIMAMGTSTDNIAKYRIVVEERFVEVKF